MASSQTQVEIGSDFLGYRIEDVIGWGGMGIVYRAYDLRLKRTVALKLVTPELALDERFNERFAREMELAMALEHPNVVPIHDAGDADGRLYLAMRLVEGTDLRALLAVEGALDPARALAICRQVASALDAAHSKGLVHRDVKPSNVLLAANEHVYLADFGLTRRLEEEGAQAGEGRSVGTPAYLAPELIEGGTADGRADVYSLGCLLFECLTGQPPYRGGSRLAVAWAHLEQEPPSASELNPGLPAEVDAVIQRALAKSPDHRYATCEALIVAAEQALGLRQRPVVRSHTLVLVGSVAVVAALLASLGIALVNRSDRPTVAPDVRENTIVRVDPETNTVSAVIDVGQDPIAAAAGGDSVWVYNRVDDTVTELDADSSDVRGTLSVSAQPVDQSLLAGPVIAADDDGAWIVGVDGRGRPLLTRALSGQDATRNYWLDREPLAVALDEGAVWVLGRGESDYQVLRVDPASGEVTARTTFPSSARLSSLSAGLGAVWAMSSDTAVLYRVDQGGRAVTGRIDLGERAGRPVLEHGIVFAGISESGSITVDPRTLEIVTWQGCCELNEGYDEDEGHGSTWWIDPPAGTLARFSFNRARGYQPEKTIAVTDPPRLGNGPCLTSVVATTHSVWVTLAYSTDGACPR